MFRLIYGLVLLLLIVTPSMGQQSLVGSYKIVSHVLDVEGTLTENLGKAPNGYLIITPTLFVMFFTADKRQFGTSVAEKAALFDTVSGYSGVYRIEGRKLITRVDASWIEHWNGKDLIRYWEVSGNRLTLTSDPQPFPRDPSKKVISRQVFEKIE